MVASEFISEGYPKYLVLRHLGLPKSTFYYTSTGKKAGKRCSDNVFKLDGSSCSIILLVNDIESLLAGEFIDYGYYKTYIHLTRTLGYKIGSSRVYQLMKMHKLLRFQRLACKRTSRNWVKDLVPQVSTSFSFMEFDIKYIYVAGKRINAQVLTVLDVYSRWNMGQYIAWNIKAVDVIKLFQKIIATYGIPSHFIVRNDNGSQFEANIVQIYLKKEGITQEFTKPATPQQNAHIESYHSIMESAVCQRIELENLVHAKGVMERFRLFYNHERYHGGLDYQSPYQFLNTKKEVLPEIDLENKSYRANITTKDKADSGSGGDQPDRNNLSD